MRRIRVRGHWLVFACIAVAGAASCGRVGFEPYERGRRTAADAGSDADAAPPSVVIVPQDAATHGGVHEDASTPSVRPLPDAAVETDAGADGATAIDAATDAKPPSWAYARDIVVVAGRVAADLTDFPLLVSVASDRALAVGVALQGGADIRFLASDGSRLDHEIELFDAATGQLVAWVRVPLISAKSATNIRLEYGNPAAANQQAAKKVWAPGYASVWHLAQSPGPGGANEIVDSTGNSPGTAEASMQDSDLVSGRIGHGINFDGTDDEITFTNKVTGIGSHTISAWVDQRATTKVDAIVAFGTDSLNEARWFYSSYGASFQVSMGLYSNDFISNTDIRGAGFTHLVWTYDGMTSALYVNGKLAQSQAHSGANTMGTNGWLGNAAVTGPRGFGPDQHLNGQLDEVRVYAGVLGAARIKAEYENAAAPSTFVTIGPQHAP